MRRATITTTHDDPDAAARVAAALRPDNTAELDTRVDGDRVVTTVARETTGGLRSTVDDYVVNCTVAARLGDGADASDAADMDASDAADEDATDAADNDASDAADAAGEADAGVPDDANRDANDTPDTDTNT